MVTWFNLFAALVISGALSWGLVPVARRVGLVDKPCTRKRHSGNVPLVGGISIFLTTAFVFLFFFEFSSNVSLFILAAALMVLIGAADDKHDLSVRVRIVAQLAVAGIIVFGSGIYIATFGDLFGFGSITLGAWGVPFTLLAIMAAMNAYNMVDGIDGLLGSLAAIAFVGIAALGYTHGQSFAVNAALVIGCAIIPFLILNLGGLPSQWSRKIFMGDAGSMFIGLTIVWLLAVLTDPNYMSDTGTAVRPVAVLWLIAVPLMDMFAIIIRRLKLGRSPFKPDRDHLHHTLMRCGYHPRQALAIICTLAASLLTFGLMLEYNRVPEYLVAAIYLSTFIVYCIGLSGLRHVADRRIQAPK